MLSRIKTLLLLTLIGSKTLVSARRKVWRNVEAIDGREAILPCEVGQIVERDMIYVVLWYLNGRKEPIYSYDNRPRGLQAVEDRHIIQSPELEGRVFFRPDSVPALHIKPVLSSDRANYTCRVDFRIANSKATHLSLRVVVPPSTPVLKVGGKAFYDTTWGPLKEGSTLRISCVVAEGEPPPEVIWLKDDVVIDSRIESQTLTRTSNELVISMLPRTFHDARLTCKAFNNNVTAPVFSSVVVTMNLRPILARLREPPRQMRIGEMYDINCVTAGSRPSPNVTWTLGNIATVTALPAVTEHSINSSISVVRLKAVRRYHGQRLSCLVINPLFPQYILSDSLILNVTYPPVAALELGRGVSPVVKEGADVYFNCMVDSNPPTYRIRWYHENKILEHSPSTGILIGGHSLALRGVSRSQGGHYLCAASNIEGDARSSPLALDVSYAPICALPEPFSKVVATGIGQPINVTCDVIASPDEVKFSWVFNNSVTSERVPGHQVILAEDGRSIVRFKARTVQDYGTLQCWAENIVGRMSSPCLYHVLPAGRPDAPVNCSVANKSYDSLVVSCHPGFDGGLKQLFEARVFEAVTGRSQLNETSSASHFVLKGLTPGLDYVIAVASRNAMGESSSVRLEAFTYKMAENRMRDNQVSSGINGNNDSGGLSALNNEGRGATIALLGGIVLILVAIGLLIVLIKRLLTRRGHSSSDRTQFHTTSSQDLPEETITLKIKGHSQEMQFGDSGKVYCCLLDTGSSLNVLSHSVAYELKMQGLATHVRTESTRISGTGDTQITDFEVLTPTRQTQNTSFITDPSL